MSSVGIGFVLAWIVCGVIHYKWWMRYFIDEYPELYTDLKFCTLERRFALLGSIGGPMALLADFVVFGWPEGWRWR